MRFYRLVVTALGILLLVQSTRAEKHTALGPLFESRSTESSEWTAYRPFFLKEKNQTGEQRKYFLYPLYSEYEHGPIRNTSIFQLFRSFESPVETTTEVWPFFFERKGDSPEREYKGLFPITGDVKHFFGFDRFHWNFFPIYAQFEKKGEIRKALPWPFYQWMEGESEGQAIWPIWGHFNREGRYDYEYWLWPLIYTYKDLDNRHGETVKRGWLPFYSEVKSANVDSENYLWPFFGYTHQKDPKYDETRYLWPFFVQGRGKKYVNRWAPFYTHSIVGNMEKKWWLWPLLKSRKWDEKGLDIQQDQLLYFLWWRNTQTTLAKPDWQAQVEHIWPLYSRWDDGNGRKQVQMLSPFEPFFPHNTIIRRLYSPLFAVYRAEWQPDGSTQRSLLFNLARMEETPKRKTIALEPLIDYDADHESKEGKIDLLKGIVRYEDKSGDRSLTLLGLELNLNDL